MKNVMLDLETMGTTSGSAIISIGAVEFDNNGIGREFYEKINLADAVNEGLTLDANTVLWWMRQSDEARKEFESGTKGLRAVLSMFAAWLDREALLWGNGSDFDNVLLTAAYNVCKINRPWNFRNNCCYRTIRKLYPDVVAKDTGGVKHNALEDARYQALHLIEIAKVAGF